MSKFAALTLVSMAACLIVGTIGRTSETALADSASSLQIAVIPIPASSATFTIRRLEGDIDGNCVVDIRDTQLVSSRFLASVGSLLYGPDFDVNLPHPDRRIDISDVQFVFGRIGSTCSDPMPPQPPFPPEPVDAQAASLHKVPNSGNIWICEPSLGQCAADIPARLDAASWQNGVTFEEVLTLPPGHEGITSYSFELTFDPSIFLPPVVTDLGVLDASGSRTTDCRTVHISSGALRFECNSVGPAGSAPRWSGEKAVARVELRLQSSLASQRAAKENGIVALVTDRNAMLESEGEETPTVTPQTPSATATRTPAGTVGPSTTTPAPATATSTRTTTVTSPTPPTEATPTRTPVPTSTAVTGLGCTPGFWKNHPEDWPVSVLVLGTVSYNQEGLLNLLDTSTNGDASLILARHLIAAKLNVLTGRVTTSILATLDEADAMLSRAGDRLPLGVTPSSPEGQGMVWVAALLAKFNEDCDASSAGGSIVSVLPATRTAPQLPSGVPATGGGSEEQLPPLPRMVIQGLALVVAVLLVMVIRLSVRSEK